ncbi:MAG: FAD-dependent tricarballylate dehydrogenase TcuA [Armatimonadota bacterium]|nr:FAD-dependent tricarballylate dehydrogenase TcuA [Armatimonadota bacterium]MDR7452511.1 FAD-dependent tricarballylate dehydrogenase TcuA [Armatimonadota bacterium]
MTPFDVVVVGGGNAGLCAALAAREVGASVLVLERAPRHWRGGNSYFTGGAFRFAYRGLEDIRTLIPDLTDAEAASIEVGAYTEDEYFADLARVTEYQADPDLANVLVRQSLSTMQWMRGQGIRWVLLFGRQAFRVGDRYRFWGGLIVQAVGGGVGLVDALFARAEAAEVEVWYRARAEHLLVDEGRRVRGVVVRREGQRVEVPARAVVLAAGGFEANPEWRARYLGPDWDLARVRGTPYNTGDGIAMALAVGAQPYGHWSGCHAVAWDANAPPFGDRRIGELFQKHSYPFGLIVNREGRRFVDEGADFRNYTYAKYGREILKQPGRVAFQIFDQKVVPLLREEYRIKEATKAEAQTLEELAEALEIDRDGLVQTVREFNAAVQPGTFDPTVLDGKSTRGIVPPKSNWALQLDTPPYLGFAVTCGITFTFGGVRVTPEAAVVDTEGDVIPGLYAAGELVGGLFYHNYPGGTGLMSGAVFGRIAGEQAAIYARGRMPAEVR